MGLKLPRAFALVLLAVASPLPARATAPLAVSAASAETEDARLARVFRDAARRADALDPLGALYRGERIDAFALRRIYTDLLDRERLAAARQNLSALGRVNRNRLSPDRQISYDVFAYNQREAIASLQPEVRELTAVRPLNHFSGLHIEFPALMAADGTAPYANEADYRRAILLDRAFAGVMDQAVLRMRQGMAGSVVESKLTVGNMIGQIDALLAQPVEQSPFYSPVLAFPDTVPATPRPALRSAFAAVIGNEVYPAYRRLRDFLANEYLPAARANVGLSSMKGGAALYRRLAEEKTTLRLDPADVHALGLTEVARIQREMDTVRQKMGFTGPLRDFFDYIRTEPRFHPKTREELANGFASVGKAVEAQIPRYFSRVPRTPLIIQPYPEYREKYEAGGSYNQGSPDGKRPGVFFYNAYDLPSRFLTGTTTLYLHEGAPGHHFQISLAQEDESLPAFQRFDGNTAFVEGWALYAETLGYEMGFYEDPAQHWGTLDDEMLRAMRLVVDTGLHTKGWSREQAIDYMLANSGMGRSDATAEVERYIAIPGQALAYKIGALTIQRLRRKAESELGAKFDIRAFHDQVLGSGALPLPVLEAKIDGWIAANRN